MSVTAAQIKKMSYTEFVGEINQWNSLPGGVSTINMWRVFGQVNTDSRYLDIACTTGLKSRTMSAMTGCQAYGIDISHNSIEAARFNAKKYTPLSQVSYAVQDGTEFKPKYKFTHVSFGASLRFFQNPQKMIDNLTSNIFEEKGTILASEFFVHTQIPQGLIDDFYKIFDIYPTNSIYKDVMTMYKGFDIFYESKHSPTPETTEELEHYCHSTISKYESEKQIKLDEEVFNIMYGRLFQIKKMSNILREYQQYNVLVMNYDKKVYPNRYIELF